MEDSGALSFGLLLLGAAITVFWIWCAYLTARNGRWGLFILGFFCGFAWIVGALLGDGTSSSPGGFLLPGQPGIDRSRRHTGRAPDIAPGQHRDDGRCPQCGKHGGQQTGRCPACGYFFGV